MYIKSSCSEHCKWQKWLIVTFLSECRWYLHKNFHSWLCIRQQATTGECFHKGKCSSDFWESYKETGSFFLKKRKIYVELTNKLQTFYKFSFNSAQIHLLLFQVLLFATSNESKTIIPIFEESAKFFKGKVSMMSINYECFYCLPFLNSQLQLWDTANKISHP